MSRRVIRRRFAHGIVNFERYKLLVDSCNCTIIPVHLPCCLMKGVQMKAPIST